MLTSNTSAVTSCQTGATISGPDVNAISTLIPGKLTLPAPAPPLWTAVTPIAFEFAAIEPAALTAVTTQRTGLPPSRLTVVYEDAVAPAMLTPFRCHW